MESGERSDWQPCHCDDDRHDAILPRGSITARSKNTLARPRPQGRGLFFSLGAREPLHHALRMNAQTVLWVYIVLMVMGGVMGFVKAGSKASLIASVTFGAILSLFALNILPFAYHIWVLLFLLIFFGMRLAKSKKMMPNGMMVILTILALALPYLIR
jgi:uncharacterized membrane protein (UPF0136 family)